MDTRDWEDNLLAALDRPYRALREQNHVEPNSVLVYDVAAHTVEAVNLMDLPLRYPCGQGNRWSLQDLGWVVQQKATLYRQSMVAHEISEEDPEAQPQCGTCVLVITTDYRPYNRLVVLSTISLESM